MGFIWTQSSLKEFEKDQTCPYRWKELWINRAYTPIPSEVQNYGNYFEYLCIGANARGGAVKSLPLTKSNEKTSVQRRIEQQVEKFKDLFDPLAKDSLGYEIRTVQRTLEGHISGIPVCGTLDIEAIEIETGTPVIIDLKLTEDAYNTFSEYGWGNEITQLDLIQPVLYQELYFQEEGVLPKMVMAIFEHGTKSRVRILNLEITEDKRRWMAERFIAGDEVKQLYDERGWIKVPSIKECKTCPLNCKDRIEEKTISIETHKY